MELAEDYRHTPVFRDIYKMRGQTIERVFADAKEKHAMRYTQLRGLQKDCYVKYVVQYCIIIFMTTNVGRYDVCKAALPMK